MKQSYDAIESGYDGGCPREADVLLLVHRALGFRNALAVRMHLAKCAECRSRYREFQQTDALLRGALSGEVILVGAATRNRRVQIGLAIAMGLAAVALALNWHYFNANPDPEFLPASSVRSSSDTTGEGDCDPKAPPFSSRMGTPR